MAQVVTPPATEPITLIEAKNWLKVDFSEDDNLISSLIVAARQYAEHYCNTHFITSTYSESFSAGSQMIFIGAGPNLAIDSVKDGDTTLALETNYSVTKQPEGILIQFNSLPDKLVTVTYTAGVSDDVDDVPDAVKNAMQLLITDWYENRADGVRRYPTAANNLLNTQRRWIT